MSDRRYGEVRVVEFDASTPVRRQLSALAASTVLVSVHTSNLANAPLMRPGAAVVELLPVRDESSSYLATFDGHFQAVPGLLRTKETAQYRHNIRLGVHVKPIETMS